MTLEQLYADYYKKLYTVAILQLHDEDAADDVTQQTFLYALRYGYDPSKGATPYTWLVNLLKWVILERFRSDHPYLEQCKGEVTVLALDDIPEWLGMDHLTIERRVDAAMALKRLAPGLRRVAEMYFLEGYTLPELREMSGVSQRTMERIMNCIYSELRDRG